MGKLVGRSLASQSWLRQIVSRFHPKEEIWGALSNSFVTADLMKGTSSEAVWRGGRSVSQNGNGSDRYDDVQEI
jgi:uncharacterized membrane protein YqgA involved in biofilm formation